jgi:hypothetical protein
VSLGVGAALTAVAAALFGFGGGHRGRR